MVRIRGWQLEQKKTSMQNWHDWAAYCAGRMELKQPIHQQKCTMSGGMGANAVSRLSLPSVHTTIVLEIPVFTRLGLKDSLSIGGLHRRTLLRKHGIY